MREYHVHIPDETFAVYQIEREGLPGIIVVNTSLRGFEPKVVFGWHLSLVVVLQDLGELGMPTEEERAIVEELEDRLHLLLVGPADQQPNALLLGRITWNGTRHFLWRVFDPEVANKDLQDLIAARDYSREFNYEMAHDPEWKEAEWLLDDSTQDILDN